MTAHWNQQQIKQFVKTAVAPWGSAFGLLGYEMQVAIIHAAALAVIRHQAREQVPVSAMDELVRRMEEAAGISA